MNRGVNFINAKVLMILFSNPSFIFLITKGNFIFEEAKT